MYFIEQIKKTFSNYILLYLEGGIHGSINTNFDANKINVDGVVKRREVREFTKYQEGKTAILEESKAKLTDFINIDMKNANIYYLSKGGKSILDLKKALNRYFGLEKKDNGYLKDEDGSFKEISFLLVKYQKEQGLTPDSLAGQNTQEKLFKDNNGEEEIKRQKSYKNKGDVMLASRVLDSLKDKKRIILRAEQAVKRGDNLDAKDCTDFVSNIWEKDVNKGKHIFKGNILKKDIFGGTHLRPTQYATRNDISKIQAGDYLLVDRPPYKSGKTHGMMAMGKAVDGVVSVISYPGYGTVPVREKWDLLGRDGKEEKTAKLARINRLV